MVAMNLAVNMPVRVTLDDGSLKEEPAVVVEIGALRIPRHPAVLVELSDGRQIWVHRRNLSS